MGRMEGKGDGKIERNLQTRRERERESESLFSLGWPRYGRCPAQELKCLRGPRSSPPAGAGTHLDHLRSAGAERSAQRKCRCGTLRLLQSGAWLGVVPAPSRGSARPRPEGGATGVRESSLSTTSGPLVLRQRLHFLPPHRCPQITPPTPKCIYLFLSANALVAAFLNCPSQFILLGLSLQHGSTVIIYPHQSHRSLLLGALG